MTQLHLPNTRNGILSRLWIGNWSIGLRLLFSFIAAVMIPAFFTFLLINNEIDTVDLDNLDAYIRDTGVHQREDINEFFVNARTELAFLAESNVYARQIEFVIQFDANQASLERIMSDYFDRRLIASGVFVDAIVLSPDGIVVASSSQRNNSGEPAFITGTDLSGSPIVRAARNAATLGDTQRMSITTGPTGLAEIRLVQMIYNLNGDIIGYLVATMNTNTLIEFLIYESEFVINARSYLATVNGDIIAPDDVINEARQSFLSSPIEDALARNSNTQLYNVGETQVIGYYGPIDEFFAYVIETDASTSFIFALREIYERTLFLVLGALLITILAGGLLAQTITGSLRSLRRDIVAIGNGDFDRTIITASRHDEIGDVSRSLVNARQQVQDIIAGLESRVQARVRDLEATQEVSRFAATQRDLQVLMDQVVDLIISRFPNIYHAQIFLIDGQREFAILRASTGEAGQKLLERGHRLEVGGVSVIGQVTDQARIVIARDTADSSIHRRNEFLPETRAELAIPLRIGDEVIGALDVQSKQNDSFNKDTTNILQIMADEIAIAIENARLYQESIQRLQEVLVSNRDSTRASWREHLNARREQTLISQTGPNPAGDVDTLRREALQTGEPVIGEKTERDTVPFAVPIILREEPLGAVQWELPAAEFNLYKVQLAQELVGRLALSLENARLFQESQQATSRERIVNDIAATLSSETDVDAILEAAVREVGQALRAPLVSITLNRDTPADETDDALLPINGASTPSNGKPTE